MNTHQSTSTNKKIKFLIMSNILFALVALYFAISYLMEEPNPTKNQTCYSCDDPFDGETIGNFVDVTSRYQTTHYKLLNEYAKGNLNAALTDPTMQVPLIDRQGASFRDSRSCWFSIERLKKFICSIENESKQIEGVDITKLGLRFYYATYNGDNSLHPNGYRRHTLFLTPTHNTEAGNEDFDPRYFNQNKEKFAKEKGYIPGLNTMIGTQSLANYKALILSGTENAGIMNQGTLCPPMCNGGGYADGNNTLQAVDNVKPTNPF